MNRLARGLGLAVLLALPCVALARVGGGSSFSGSRSSSSSGSRSSSFSSGSRSYSGSSSSSGWGSSSGSSYTYTYSGSSGSGDGFGCLLVMLVVLVVAVVVVKAYSNEGGYQPSIAPSPPLPSPNRDVAARLRSRDPSFSEAVFLEWVTLLYLRAMQGRGVPAAIEAVAPWFADPASQLSGRIGAHQVTGVRGGGGQPEAARRATGARGHRGLGALHRLPDGRGTQR